jgi:hypothetical protein
MTFQIDIDWRGPSDGDLSAVRHKLMLGVFKGPESPEIATSLIQKLVEFMWYIEITPSDDYTPSLSMRA